MNKDHPDYTLKLATDIVTRLETKWPELRTLWDSEDAISETYYLLPETLEAAQAAWDQLSVSIPKPSGPGLGAQLRNALEVGKDMKLADVLRLAIERLQEQKE